ncbi:plasma membrane calcium [Rhinocladiella similis]
MVTGDNLLTAKAVSEECGILDSSSASPDDKKLLVCQLKKLGEAVAVTGDGTNDAQALKLADVGFAMGIAGTEVAKEASDIILLDDNFSSLVKAISWGRTVNDAVEKFLQLLWINLIMDTFAALALATDPPSSNVLKRKPGPRTSIFPPGFDDDVENDHWGQSIYQLAVTLTLKFAGRTILGYHTSELINQQQTLAFSTFVWMQFFNQFNCRRLDNGLNLLERIHRNGSFVIIQCIIVAGQIMIIFIGGQAFSVHRLNGTP